MKILRKIFIFIGLFSLAFFLLRNSEYYTTKLLFSDLGGITWLYSAIGIIFSIIAAFTIQKEWEQWNNLVDAVKSEVDALEELRLWSVHFPAKIKSKFHTAIRNYLKIVIQEEWTRSEKNEECDMTGQSLDLFHDAFFEIFDKKPELMTASFTIFTDVLRYRGQRIHYINRHMPLILRRTLVLAVNLVIFLSLFIAVKSIWLDYIFTLSIAVLTYTVYLVIDDLEHPLRPGGWHLTRKDYQCLLDKINSQN